MGGNNKGTSEQGQCGPGRGRARPPVVRWPNAFPWPSLVSLEPSGSAPPLPPDLLRPSSIRTEASLLCPPSMAPMSLPWHRLHSHFRLRLLTCLFTSEATLLKAGAASYSLLYPPVAQFLTQSQQVFKNVSFYWIQWEMKVGWSEAHL